jgi:hypothetical protein
MAEIRTNYHTHAVGNWGHNHTWYDSTTVAPTAGWIGGSATDISSIRIDHNYRGNDVQFWADDIMVQNRNLTKAMEDMATLLKIIVERYDLHEVKELVEKSEVAVWAQDKEVREKKDHLDEKLFEI